MEGTAGAWRLPDLHVIQELSAGHSVNEGGAPLFRLPGAGMSGRLNITFAPDMPGATVEVVAPDLTTIDRLWLTPGQQKAVDVPSEATFLRVHLSSGEIVTLDDPGNLN